MPPRSSSRHPARSGRVTIEQVAEAVGVSRQTVSRAINGAPDISEATRDRVLEAVTKMGYRPNRIAQGLVTRRTMTAGLVIADIANPFFPELARGAEDVAEGHGFHLLFSSYAATHMNEIVPMEALADRGVDGIILVPSGRHDADVEAFARRYDELVVVNSQVGGPRTQVVSADLTRGGQLVAEHLIEIGRRTLGMLVIEERGADDRLRVAAFRATAAEAGLPLADDAVEYAPATLEGGRDGASRLLARRPDIDGLFCFNDVMAIGALTACRERGMNVPGQCAVVGFDGLLIGEIVTPALTSVLQNPYRLGEAAMQHLIAMIDGRPAGEPDLQPVSLALRASSAS